MPELTWKDVRDRVKTVNPELFRIIDEISPDESYTLFEANYQYGNYIIKDGELFFPDSEGGVISLNDSRVSNDIKDKLGYVRGTNPMTLVLKNNFELFIQTENRIIPFSILEPGTSLGIWAVLQCWEKRKLLFTSVPLWSMTAGARSIFVLPKVSNMSALYKLKKKFAIGIDRADTLQEHWQFLKGIANGYPEKNPWEASLLYFSKKWAESIHDPAWYKLKNYLSELAWKSTDFRLNQFCWDLTFSRIQEKRGIKPCPYVADITSHLLSIPVGASPGFRPLLDEKSAPINTLQKAFEEEYNLKYSAVFIGPANFNIFSDADYPVYYSFHYHTVMKLSAKSSERSSIITDMYNIRSLLEKYCQDILQTDLKIENTILAELVKLTDFKFCHHISDDINKMEQVNDVILSDPAFLEAINQCKIKEIPRNSPFLNGCVQISKK